MAEKTTARTMSAEHKEALAAGRREGHAVRAYLEAIDANKPKRGRRRTRDSIGKRLQAIDNELATADKLKALLLRQERRDLQAELSTMEATVDLSALENEFVTAAKSYGERKGISYVVWRESGVSAEVLRRAGIPRRD